MKFLKALLFLLCIPFLSWGSEISLKEKLSEAQTGSFIVTEQNKTFTFLHIFEKQNGRIALEEVVIPAPRFFQQKMAWRNWFEHGAPGHTSWTLSQINLQTGQLEEVFSFTHQGWIDVSVADPFMSTLLNLTFKEVPDNQRQRIGLPPGYGKPDYRPLWNPRLCVDGTSILQVPFSVWKTRWPCDGTELSRKIIEIYLPDENAVSSLPYIPSYFPYWLEVEGKIGNAKIRVVDSGMGVTSPKPRFPHRPPQLIGEGSLDDGGLAFQLKTQNCVSDFLVIAEETTSCFGKTFPLPCQATLNEGLVTLFIAREELEKCMVQGERYRFSISVRDDPSVSIETKHSIDFR